MKKFFKRQWPLIALALLLAVVGLYLSQGLKSPIKGPVIKEILSGEGLQLKDIHYVQDNPDEGLKWILDAKEVTFSEDRSSIAFQEFQLKVEPRNRSPIRLKGEKGDYAKDTGVINLRGNLELSSEDGFRMVTDQVRIHEKRRHLRTDQPVKIFGPSFSISGRGLFLDLDRERLQVLSDCKTVIKKELSAL